MSRQYLDVPYLFKDAAKALGARFDGTAKRWYVEAGVALVAFSAWLAFYTECEHHHTLGDRNPLCRTMCKRR